MKTIITFENVSEAMACESELKKREIQVKLIPTPRSLSTSCGISARISPKDKELVLDVLKESKIEYDVCHDME